MSNFYRGPRQDQTQTQSSFGPHGGGGGRPGGGGGNFNSAVGNFNSNFKSGGNNFNKSGGSNFNAGGGSNFNAGGGSNFNAGGGSNFNAGGGSNFNAGRVSNFNAGANNFGSGGGNFNTGGNNFNNGGNNLNSGGNFNRNGPHTAPNRLNPWEGGIVPGGGLGVTNLGGNSVGNLGNNRGMGGLLPTPTLPTSGLLQQLSTQEAQTQLAIASNMLSALLPSLQAPQQNQVPPLLGMNNNRGGLLPLNPPAGGFQNQNFSGPGPHQDNVGPNRVSPRARPALRRPEPYNKMGNRNQRPGQKTDDRKGGGGTPRSGGDGTASPKKGSQQARNKSEDSKREDMKSDSGRNDSDKRKGAKDTESDDKAKAAYNDIPSEMLFCHVCNKNMWDSASFSNHMKGRAHQMMMDQLEESYRIKTELMRHEMKVSEQQHQIELDRKQRHGKVVGSQTREYCTMCDLHFTGNIGQHRKNSLHQQLKSFLHPKCRLCSKEFSTRLDWDQHQLSAEHLKNQSVGGKSKQKREEIDNGVKKDVENSKSDLPKGKTNVEKSLEEKTAQPSESIQVKKEEPLSPPVNNKIPDFDPAKEIGAEMLQEKTGYLCRCCNRFLSCPADAKTHCRSAFHYEKYKAHLEAKVLQANKSPRSEPSESPKKAVTNKVVNQEDGEQEEEEEDDEDEGNWKRRKVVKDDDSQKANEVNEPMDINQESSNLLPTEENAVVSNDEKVISDKGDDPPAAESSENIGDENKEGGIERGSPDANKLWIEIDKDLGALLQSVEEDEVKDSSTENAEDLDATVLVDNNTAPSSTPSTPRGGRRGARGGSAIRSRTRKRK